MLHPDKYRELYERFHSKKDNAIVYESVLFRKALVEDGKIYGKDIPDFETLLGDCTFCKTHNNHLPAKWHIYTGLLEEIATKKEQKGYCVRCSCCSLEMFLDDSGKPVDDRNDANK